MDCRGAGGGRCDNYIKTRVEMSFVSDYLTPFLEYYGRLLDGPYLAQQLQFKGSQEIGGDYINKVHRAQRRAITEQYPHIHAATNQPSRQCRVPPFPASSPTTFPASCSTVPPSSRSFRTPHRRLPSLSQSQVPLRATGNLQSYLHRDHE